VTQLLTSAPGPQKPVCWVLCPSFRCCEVVGEALEGEFCMKSFTSAVTSVGVTLGVPVRTEFRTDGVKDSVLLLPTPSQEDMKKTL